MSNHRWILLATMFGIAGCCNSGHRSCGPKPCDRCPGPVAPAGAAPFTGAGPAGPPPAAPGAFVSPPPPTPATPVPPATSAAPAMPTTLPPFTPPTGTVGRSPSAAAPVDPRFRPISDPQDNGPPRALPDSASARVQLQLPVPVRTEAKPSADPPRSSDRIRPEPAPVKAVDAPLDVQQFAVLRDRVASGKQPFPDGIAWLRNKGYRTALHLRTPGEDNSAVRPTFEQFQMRYLTLEVSPDTLTKDLLEQFNRILADEANLPLFICDNRDCGLTGCLCYLHFRSNKMTDEQALAETARLGFRPAHDPDHKVLLDSARILVATMAGSAPPARGQARLAGR